MIFLVHKSGLFSKNGSMISGITSRNIEGGRRCCSFLFFYDQEAKLMRLIFLVHKSILISKKWFNDFMRHTQKYQRRKKVPFLSLFLGVGSETNAHDFSCTQVHFN
jgi:hypothetical protein